MQKVYGHILYNHWDYARAHGCQLACQLYWCTCTLSQWHAAKDLGGPWKFGQLLPKTGYRKWISDISYWLRGGNNHLFDTTLCWIHFTSQKAITVHIVHMIWQETYPDSKVHGANMGLIWGWQDPGGPHVGPMNFAIWVKTKIPEIIYVPPCIAFHPYHQRFLKFIIAKKLMTKICTFFYPIYHLCYPDEPYLMIFWYIRTWWLVNRSQYCVSHMLCANL